MILFNKTVPGVPRKNNYVNIKTRTTYDRHFNETVQPKATEVRELARQHGVQSLQRQFYLAKDEGSFSKFLIVVDKNFF